MADLTGAQVEEVREIVNLMALGEWGLAARRYQVSGGSWDRIRATVEAFGREHPLVTVPLALGPHVTVDRVADGSTWVRCPFWSEDEGRSSLVLSARLFEMVPESALWDSEVLDVGVEAARQTVPRRFVTHTDVAALIADLTTTECRRFAWLCAEVARPVFEASVSGDPVWMPVRVSLDWLASLVAAPPSPPSKAKTHADEVIEVMDEQLDGLGYPQRLGAELGASALAYALLSWAADDEDEGRSQAAWAGYTLVEFADSVAADRTASSEFSATVEGVIAADPIVGFVADTLTALGQLARDENVALSRSWATQQGLELGRFTGWEKTA